ncbi:MAG: hypothetical protein HYY17_10165 [Planctomycetes bacterium]|nr:hypothetical protein [Planctomycetota bacterium]
MKRSYKNSGFAGEMLVAAELSRLGYEVLLGNVGTKRTVGVDLAAVDPVTGRTVSVSVKSVREPGAFRIDPEHVCPRAVYVFVITHEAGQSPEFFVVRGEWLLDNDKEMWGKWGKAYEHPTRRGVRPKRLEMWRNKWDVIDVRDDD